MLQRTVLLFLLCGALLSAFASQAQGKGVLLKRQTDDHGHEEEDEHGHEEEAAASAQCAVTEHILEHEFNELAEELSLTGPDGALCVIEEDHHGDEGNETDHHDDEMDHHGDEPLNLTCENTFEFFGRLLVRLNLTTDCCLENGTACEEPTEEAPTAGRTGVSEAYGYGFLMILVVSALSLVGIVFVPFLKKGSKFGKIYKYLYALLIALGASALFCDAILHLIPEAFGLHDHAPEEDAHAHEEEEEDQTFIWKGVVVIAGTYFFFLFETILHTWNPHDKHSNELEGLNSSEDDDNSSETKGPLVNGKESENGGQEVGDICLEPTMPHSQCKDGKSNGILHPTELENGGTDEETPLLKDKNLCVRFYHYLRNIKPLAWLIIFGDAIHNFADGLALGAAIAQSLSLGVSTMIALIFHELPHELGDYVILISTGMSWYVALIFNFISALTAVIGFFVGVAISTNSEEASSWILAIAAGVFIYIALVDLLPELIHSKEKGLARWLLFLMANIGFLISFVALLLIAVYEEQLNSIVSL